MASRARSVTNVMLRAPTSALAFAMILLLFAAVGATREFGSSRTTPTRVNVMRLRMQDSSLTRTNSGMVVRAGAPFTGVTTDSDPDFGSRIETPHVRGLRHGVERAWFANGQRMYERAYVRGQEQGSHRGWYANGNSHFVYEYRNGVMSGRAREWYPNGQLYREFHYTAGHEDGAQQMWFPNGAQRANYVIKGGRRYGLPGSKGCTGTTLNAPSADNRAEAQPR